MMANQGDNNENGSYSLCVVVWSLCWRATGKQCGCRKLRSWLWLWLRFWKWKIKVMSRYSPHFQPKWLGRFAFGVGASLFISSLSFICAAEDSPYDMAHVKPLTEWEAYFTGPLLSPVGTVTPVGIYNIEPYVFATVQNGLYDNHWRAHKTPNLYSLTPAIFFTTGLVDRVDVTLFVPYSYNWSEGQRSSGINDINGAFGFQFWEGGDQMWNPWIQLALSFVVPTGRYRNLNPQKNLIDAQGGGSWGGDMEIIFYKLLHIENEHFLSLNLAFEYLFLKSTSVRNFNVFGGGVNTRGRVRPGNKFITTFSFEYSFTKHWACAMDTIYTHAERSVFSGCPGIALDCTVANMGLPSSEQLTFSPAIEYNFSPELGLIGGVWFTAIGRNTNRFQAIVVAFNWVL
jgi:hypothetical protein